MRYRPGVLPRAHSDLQSPPRQRRGSSRCTHSPATEPAPPGVKSTTVGSGSRLLRVEGRRVYECARRPASTISGTPACRRGNLCRPEPPWGVARAREGQPMRPAAALAPFAGKRVVSRTPDGRQDCGLGKAPGSEPRARPGESTLRTREWPILVGKRLLRALPRIGGVRRAPTKPCGLQPEARDEEIRASSYDVLRTHSLELSRLVGA